MTKPTHWLVTGISEAELERLTGLRGRMTDYGVLVEAPKPFDLYGALAEIDRALNPNRCRCRGVLHQPTCPLALACT